MIHLLQHSPVISSITYPVRNSRRICLIRYSRYVDTADLLRDARRGAGLTQAELASRAGTSQAMIARYERGLASPTVRTLRRLLHAAGRELSLSSERSAGSGGSANPPLAAVLREHRSEINAAARRAGARNVRVFGSAARGQETPESDVDLLVDFPARKRGLFPLLVLASEVEKIVGRHVDVAAVEVLDDAVRERALAEAVQL